MANTPEVTFRCRHEADCAMLFVSGCRGGTHRLAARGLSGGRIHFSQLTVPEDVPRLWDEVSAAIEQTRPYHVKFSPGGQAGQHALGV